MYMYLLSVHVPVHVHDLHLGLCSMTSHFQGAKTLPNPIDVNYDSLSTDLEHLDKKSDEFKVNMCTYMYMHVHLRPHSREEDSSLLFDCQIS